MDVFCDGLQNYWEINTPLHEFDSWMLDDILSPTYYDSSSPDGVASQLAPKNIVLERNRRRKLNERLFALRSVVPNITKMDKASIIKDAIDHLNDLHEQERRIKAEISELECQRLNTSSDSSAIVVDQVLPNSTTSKKRKAMDDTPMNNVLDSHSNWRSSTPIEDFELRVRYVGEKTVVVGLTCNKREGTMVKLCEIFETLKLKIITAHITSFSGRLCKTIFIQADEGEKDYLRIQIERVISSSS